MVEETEKEYAENGEKFGIVMPADLRSDCWKEGYIRTACSFH